MRHAARGIERKHARGNALENGFHLTPALVEFRVRCAQVVAGSFDLHAAGLQLIRHAVEGAHKIANFIRAAYVDIVNRMVQFHGFTMPEAYLLACQTARVRIGQVVDPLYCAAVTIERRYIS